MYNHRPMSLPPMADVKQRQAEVLAPTKPPTAMAEHPPSVLSTVGGLTSTAQRTATAAVFLRPTRAAAYMTGDYLPERPEPTPSVSSSYPIIPDCAERPIPEEVLQGRFALGNMR